MANFTPVALEIFGGLTKAYGAYSTGKAQKAEAEFEAKQMEINAGQAKAASQRAAAEEVRQGKLVESRILAVAAASGGGASDPTIVRLIGKQAGEGAYRAAVAIYQGDEKARVMRMGAAAKRYEGKSAASLGMSRAIGALAGVGGTLYSKYGQKDATAESEVATDENWWGDGGWK